MVFLTSNANVADEGTEGRANEMKVEIILANVEAGKIALPVFQPANGLECSASDQAGVTRNPPAHRAGLLPGPEHRHGRPKGDLVCQDREDCRGVCLPARDTWTGSDPWRAATAPSLSCLQRNHQPTRTTLDLPLAEIEAPDSIT